MTTILGIETSTAACSVALYREGDVQCEQRVMPREHNRHVLAMADSLLCRGGISPGDLDTVVFGHGPGSFTGTRIAAGIAQGVALGRGIPARGFSSLQVLAAAALGWHAGDSGERSPSGALCCLWARPGEIHLGVYGRGPAMGDRAGVPRALAEEVTLPVEAIELPEALTDDWICCGDAAQAVAERLGEPLQSLRVATQLLPRASVLVRLAAERGRVIGGVDAAEAVPVYPAGASPWRKTGRSLPRQ